MHAQRCACCVVHESLIRSGAALKEPVPAMATDALSACDKIARVGNLDIAALPQFSE